VNLLFATAEAYPFVKTGGLADVSAALPAALAASRVSTRIILPGYPQALQCAGHLTEVARFDDMPGFGKSRLLETNLPGSSVKVWLVDCPDLYNRSGGPYQDESGADWPDNQLRFALFSHVAAEAANGAVRGWTADIVHANDWHCGLLPLLCSMRSGPRPATVFTVHNLAYQGLFDAGEFGRLEIPADQFQQLEFYGRLSFMKAGIAAADAITTVSPNYAREILTPEFGCGLDGLLRERQSCITGILNGADYGVWDPAVDPHIARNYTSQSLGAKLACKHAIQNELGLPASSGAPLLAFMSRLVHQKTPDLVLHALPALLEDGVQFALVAEGESQYEHAFKELETRYPGQVAVKIEYREDLAHRLLAGADLLLHPSRYEPCGLVPIYALRYGTIPVVRKSGGMADTVLDATREALNEGTATGFHFEPPTAAELISTVRRATSARRQDVIWRRLLQNAMHQDFGWHSSAKYYASLYNELRGADTPYNDSQTA
jgi:starch synthase